jgi:hypothetical protein
MHCLICGIDCPGSELEALRTRCEEYAKREKILVEILERISAHGCCVMHNDSSCPGCEAKAALNLLRDSGKD